MSTVSVRIDESLVSAARAAAKAEFRTVQGQVEFWPKWVGSRSTTSDLPASFIAESLMSMAEPREDSTVFVPCRRPRHDLGRSANATLCSCSQETARQHVDRGGCRRRSGGPEPRQRRKEERRPRGTVGLQIPLPRPVVPAGLHPRWDVRLVYLEAVGPHENFYRDLKR